MQEIEAWFKAGCGAGSARLEAVPGAGKTHLLVMLSRSMGPRDAIVAFSRDIKNELERRVKPGTPSPHGPALAQGARSLQGEYRSSARATRPVRMSRNLLRLELHPRLRTGDAQLILRLPR